MRVLNYLEIASPLRRSGIGTAVSHQRRALDGTDLTVLTSPWIGGTIRTAATDALVGDGAFARYDVAHCNLFGPGSVAVAVHARRNGIPLVAHAHAIGEEFAGSFRFSSRIAPPLGRYLRWFYGAADLVLAPSDYAAESLRGQIEPPVRVITNGVDAERLAGFESLRPASRERFGLDSPVVSTVGNVFERKGVTVFCELARTIDADFAWFGPYDTGLHGSSIVRRWVRNPPNNVTFAGWVDDVRTAYAAGDVYLFPTKVETQGIAVLEAMACGKPVVLRDIPVFEEFYTDGVDCLKCRSRPEFRAAIERLLGDPELRERLGDAARRTAAEHGLDRVADGLSAAYSTATRVVEE